MIRTGEITAHKGWISYKKGTHLTKAAALCALLGGSGYLLWSTTLTGQTDSKLGLRLGQSLASLLVGTGAGHLALNRLKKVHYQPRVRYIGPSDKDALLSAMEWKDGKRHITLYMHGWDWGPRVPYGDWAHHEKHIGTLPGVAATVDFPESGCSSFLRYLFTASLGQRPDALVVIYALKKINEELNPDVITLYGFSRGTAAAVNAEAILANTTGQYDLDLAGIGVTNTLRKQLLEKIRRGALILNTPIGNGNDAIARRARWLPRSFKLFATWALSNYHPAGPHADQSASAIKTSGGRNIFIYFEKHDIMTGNKKENIRLCSRFLKNNPDITILEGNDGDSWGFGGHAHHLTGGETFVKEMNAFREKHGYPYTPENFIRPTVAF